MNNIANLRKHLGITQKELANILNISRSTIAMWECGDSDPSIETLKKISEEFNISIDFLLNDGDVLGNHNRIRELREENGLQQNKLALELGVSQPTISDWENGRKIPSAQNSAKIADYFGTSIDYVLGRAEEHQEEFYSFRLKELRQTHNISQQKLADLLNVNQSAVSQWEKGRNFPVLPMIIKIAKVFNVSIDYLVGANDVSAENQIETANTGPDDNFKKQLSLFKIIGDLDSDEIEKLYQIVSIVFPEKMK